MTPLNKSYGPEMIIRCGSYAYGNPTSDSAIGLLIIKCKNVIANEVKQSVRQRHNALRLLRRCAPRKDN